jgi:hypothetical protein
METERIRFYHGTDSKSALSIISDGFKDALAQLGANKLAAELWTTLSDLRSEDELIRKFWHGAEAVAALRSLSNSSTDVWLPWMDGRFCYGDCYASPNPAEAYEYTVGNPLRSERLMMISDALDALRSISPDHAERIASNYPSVVQRINEQPRDPVVIELYGIESYRLRTQKGSLEIEDEMDWFSDHDYERPYRGGFRIMNVSPRDIVAVHDLSGWTEDDLPDRPYLLPRHMAGVRMTVPDWLNRVQGGVSAQCA